MTMTPESIFVEESDVDLLSDLVSGKADQNRIEACFLRFQNDIEADALVEQDYWKDRLKELSLLGFHVKESFAAPRSITEPSAYVLPAEFDTPSGKKHVLAIAKLLRISSHRALTLTLSALQEASDNTDLRSTLGTQSFVKTVVEYSHSQRAARLLILAECLRMEQDVACPIFVYQQLEKIDTCYKMDSKNRGLMRRLISLATAPDSRPRRDELLPLKDMLGNDDQFVTSMMKEPPNLREYALEALVVLLYSRVKVSRCDVILLLQAFASYRCFFTELPQRQRRLTLLCGLVCAECFSLRNVTGTNWVDEHPILVGILHGTATAQDELEAMRILMLEYSTNLVQRRGALLAGVSNAPEIIVDAPESLAILAFGLLLQLAYTSLPTPNEEMCMYWHKFKGFSWEFTKTASELLGAFGYLDSTMRGLLMETDANGITTYEEAIPYDWQWSMPIAPTENHANVSHLDATKVLYTNSIGLELLSAILSAFSGSILTCTENISMLANLAAVIYSNNPIMCEPFWKDCQTFDACSKLLSPNQQVAALLNATYILAATAMNQIEEQSLPSIAPLMRLLSSLCFDSDSSSRVLGMLPVDLIENSLLLSAPTGYLVDEAGYSTSVRGILESIYTIAILDKTMLLQKSLKAEGPRLVYSILSSTKEENVKNISLKLIGALMSDDWAISTCKLFDHDTLEHYFTTPNLTVPAVDLLCVFIHSMSSAVVKSPSEKETLGYLNVILRSVLDACSVFAMSVLSIGTKRKSDAGNPSLPILQALASFIRSIRQIIILHPSSTIRAAASECRNALIQTLATNTQLGCALAHSACSPVMMTLVLELELDFAEANQLNFASNECAVDKDTNRFGAWRNLIRNASKSDTTEHVRIRFHERLLNIQGIKLDTAAVSEQGWADHDVAQLAASAIEILGLWAFLVDDILAERFDLVEPLPLDAITFIKSTSPNRLILSRALLPPRVGATSSLSIFWQSESLSVLDILSTSIFCKSNVSTCSTFDLLTVCIQHETSVGEQNPVLQRALAPKGQLSLVLFHSLHQCCTLLSGGTIGSSNSEMTKILSQGIRTLNLLQVIIVSQVCSLQFLTEGTVLESLKNIVFTVAASMKMYGSSLHQQLLDDDVLLVKVRLLSEILHAFTMAQKIGHSPASSLPTILSSNFSSAPFLSDLSSMVSTIVSTHSSASALDHRASSILNNVLSYCFDLLAAEAVDEMNNSKIRDKDRIATNGITQNCGLSGFESNHNSLNFHGPVLVSQAFGRLVSRTQSIAILSQPLSLQAAFPVSITSNIFLFSHGTCDVVEAISWFSNLDASEDFSAFIKDLDIANSLLVSELALVSSWSRISQVFSLASCFSTIATVSCVIEQYCQNCKGLEEAMLQENESRVLATILMCDSFSSVLVSHFQQFESTTPSRQSDELLAMLTSTLEKQMALSASRSVISVNLQVKLSETLCTSQQRLLTCCTSLIMTMQRNNCDMNENQNMLLRLMDITGACVVHAIQASDNPKMLSPARNLCCAAMSFLTLCISVSSGRPSFYAGAAEAMELHGTVKHLIVRASSEEFEKDDARAIHFLNATLQFILIIAEAGISSPGMASLLIDHQLPKLLVSCPLRISESRRWSENAKLGNEGMRYRGYIPSAKVSKAVAKVEGITLETDRLLLSGKDDPLHALWVDAIVVVRTLARMKSIIIADPNKRRFFVNIAIDFVTTHKSTLLSCLHHCHSSTSESVTVLTYNIVREATEVFSLVTELCNIANKDLFECSCPELYREFVLAAKSVVGSISMFLGSSGTARELFSLLAKIDSLTGQDNQSNQYDQPQEIHLSFSSGSPSDRHEAIRNAHLARRCYALVTKSEYDASSIENLAQGKSSQFSAATLEQSCQKAVNSPFNLKMEHAAALCLSYAISILWKTHPISSGFIMFTEEESQQLNAMALVKPGMIVALRDNARLGSIQFARVQSIDTVKRTWNVSYLHSELSQPLGDIHDVVVHAAQLAGMEDLMKRKTILKYVPAPDSAIELENGGPGRNLACVGHLIIALRWCYQHEGEGPFRDLLVRRSLAAGASMLLSTEISLHKELGTTRRFQTNEDMKRVNQQLYHIFDTSCLEVQGDLSQSMHQEHIGRLQKLIGLATWNGIQQQLWSQIDSAREAKQQEQEQRKAALLSSNPWLHGVRSPF